MNISLSTVYGYVCIYVCVYVPIYMHVYLFRFICISISSFFIFHFIGLQICIGNRRVKYYKSHCTDEKTKASEVKPIA